MTIADIFFWSFILLTVVLSSFAGYKIWCKVSSRYSAHENDPYRYL